MLFIWSYTNFGSMHADFILLDAVSQHSSSFFFFFFLEKALKFFLNSEHIKKINVSVIVEVKLDN